MQDILHNTANYVALALQVIAIVVVAIGSARALVNMARAGRAAHVAPLLDSRTVWLEHARWLVAGLTFQLAADIVATSFSTTWDELGRLAVVAVVRTFLSYFLDREIEQTANLVVKRTELRTALPGRGD